MEDGGPQMLDAVKDFLASLTGAEVRRKRPRPDERLLTSAALLVHLALVDGRQTDRETRWLRDAVARHAGLTGADADRFLALARARAEEAGDFAELAGDLRRRITPDQARLLVTLMWRMALADGGLHEFEDDLITRAAELLGIGGEDARAIRDREAEGAAG